MKPIAARATVSPVPVVATNAVVDVVARVVVVARRVVVVVDAPAALGDQVVPLKLVAAVHADLADRPADADPDEDLGWFATQEIPDLI